ncbi:glycine-rich cell wall structural protein [Vigna radiata var. radiata]|uniref:Glycine-rich cell wall structural protein n=1 Tax=Vigna radiata var. radiata TaxID=3916 RepID=A0A1S3W063_VIGRR|nr:glycine-rich cell wall structural protein [Vigna radiata var. radiata]
MENAAEGGSEAGCSGAAPGVWPDGPGAGGDEMFGLGACAGGEEVGGGVEGDGVGVGVGVGGAGAGAGTAAGGGVFAVGDGVGADVGGDGVPDGGWVGAGPGACAKHAVAKSPNTTKTLTAE